MGQSGSVKEWAETRDHLYPEAEAKDLQRKAWTSQPYVRWGTKHHLATGITGKVLENRRQLQKLEQEKEQCH